MTLTIKLGGNWNSFQLANSAPPLSVTDSAIAPSARMNWATCSRYWGATAMKHFVSIRIRIRKNTLRDKHAYTHRWGSEAPRNVGCKGRLGTRPCHQDGLHVYCTSAIFAFQQECCSVHRPRCNSNICNCCSLRLIQRQRLSHAGACVPLRVIERCCFECVQIQMLP